MVTSVQDLFLGVDGLSPVQWHPYSTVGGDGEHTLVAHIKAYGKWVPVHALIPKTFQVDIKIISAKLLRERHHTLQSVKGLEESMQIWESLKGTLLRHTRAQKACSGRKIKEYHPNFTVQEQRDG